MVGLFAMRFFAISSVMPRIALASFALCLDRIFSIELKTFVWFVLLASMALLLNERLCGATRNDVAVFIIWLGPSTEASFVAKPEPYLVFHLLTNMLCAGVTEVFIV